MKYSLTFNMLGLTFRHSNMASVWTVLSLCLVRVWHKLTQMPQTHTKTGSHPPTNANMSWVTKQQSNTFIITPAYMPADFEFKQRFTNWMKIALYYQSSHTFHSVFENRRQSNWNLTNVTVVWVNCAFCQYVCITHRLGRDSSMYCISMIYRDDNIQVMCTDIQHMEITWT